MEICGRLEKDVSRTGLYDYWDSGVLLPLHILPVFAVLEGVAFDV